jgi:aspartyl-tRNA(Asn)/glutamyl-tRNA(Gln) amidotransferase subunit A
VIGKTNLDEFAMGSSTENSAFGPTRNPLDPSRVPGGSSGGSAAAVAAGFAPWRSGPTPAARSVNRPRSAASSGSSRRTARVSRYGLVAFASSLDQIGPFTHTVADAALALQVVAGHDPMDSTSIPEPVPEYSAVLDRGVDGLRVGRITDLPEGADPDVVARTEEAFAALAEAGATIVDVQVPAFTYGLTAYYLIAPAEASSNLARYDGVRYGLRVDGADIEEMMRNTRTAGFGDEVKRRILLGTYALSAGYYDAYYGKALKIRRLMANDFAAAYERCDVLLTPASPSVAFPFGDKTADPFAMYLCDTYTIPANLTGDPAMSVPFGTGADGLPVGVQVIAPALGEPVMLQVAAELERREGCQSRPRPESRNTDREQRRCGVSDVWEWNGYEMVVGLEVHVELATRTKLFSASPNRFGDDPNTNIDPVTLGLPGALPVLNRHAVELAMRIGLALNCTVQPCTFARKNYFYPDMPKAYQISQYEDPLNVDGWLDLPDGTRVGIERAHMEEDAGKTVHAGESGPSTAPSTPSSTSTGPGCRSSRS